MVTNRLSPNPLLASDLADLEQTLPTFLTPAELADLFRAKRTSGYELAQRIGCVRVGRHKLVRVSRGAVLRFLAAQTTNGKEVSGAT